VYKLKNEFLFPQLFKRGLGGFKAKQNGATFRQAQLQKKETDLRLVSTFF